MIPLTTRLQAMAVAVALVIPAVLPAQSPRMVLVEEATNASCGPCAAQNPFFEYYLGLPHNEAKIIPIVYHANFPGIDVMNAANPVMHDARRSYYAINGVPTVTVNGKIPTPSGASYAGAPSDTVAIARDANLVAGTMSPITITVTEARAGDNVDVTVDVASTEALSGKMLRVAVVERHHYYTNAGNNGEKDFHYVARQMLPDHNGFTLDLNAGETKSFSGSYSIDASWNSDEIYVVAFVQDDATKQVLQAATDRGQTRMSVIGRTAAVLDQSGAARSWPGNVETNVTGTHTVQIDKVMPDSWTVDVKIGGQSVVGGGTIVLDDAQKALDVAITPSVYAPGKGKVTVTLKGERGAVQSKTFTLYSDGLQALVILKDEGRPEISTYYEQAMARGEVSYAVVERGDEDLFDWREHVVVYEVGKAALTAADIPMLKSLIDQGGTRLYMIGAEIGYGLADPANNDPGTPRDLDFMRDYLHADYVRDDNPSSTIKGIAGDPVGDGMTFSITTGVQNQDTPDELAPRAGALPVFYYGSNQNAVAGIRYADAKNRLVFLGFGAEGLGDLAKRGDLLERGIAWLMGSEQTMSAPSSEAAMMTSLGEARPNPASSIVEIPFTLARPSHVTISIYDMRGEKIATTADRRYDAGAQSVRFDLSGMPAGAYSVVMNADGVVRTQMISVVR